MSKPGLHKSTAGLAWEDLRSVLAIARNGSLSGAARELHLEHSTVYRRLRGIERRLGVKLFERARSGYLATPHGELVAESARSMEETALAVERQVRGADARLRGVVRIATSEVVSGLLTEVLGEFLASHPEIEVEVTLSNHLADMTRREADLALRATNAPAPHLIGRELGEIRYALYGPRGRRPADPALRPWIGFDDSLAGLEVARWQRQQTSATRLRFDSLGPMPGAVAAGLGLGVLPVFAAAQHSGLARIGAMLEQPRMKLWVLSHREVRENARVRALSHHLAARLPGVLQRLQAD
jgi:DNA-binding transcriptional LysR family regulator